MKMLARLSLNTDAGIIFVTALLITAAGYHLRKLAA
jgi:hypothetical protein